MARMPATRLIRIVAASGKIARKGMVGDGAPPFRKAENIITASVEISKMIDAIRRFPVIL